MVARQAHNLEVIGSSPFSATPKLGSLQSGSFLFCIITLRDVSKRRFCSIMKTANSTTLQRTLWVDSAKVVGIWLVILGHLRISNDLINIIYSFHMPLFFFLSGYLERNKSIKDNLKNNIKTLLIPYVILYLINYLWWIPVSLLRHPEIYGEISLDNALLKPFLGMILGIGRDTPFSIMITTPLWFLVGLFFVKFIHNILQSICKENILFYTLCSIAIIGVVFAMKYLNINLLFSIDSALLAFPFFAIGNILKKKNGLKIFEQIGKKYLLFLFAIIGYIILVIIVPFNKGVNIGGFSYGENIFLCYFIGMIGIFSTILLSLIYTKSNKIVTTIASGTIIIMAFHGIVASFILSILDSISESITMNPLVNALVALITVFIFVFPIMIIKNYFPIITGGRK